MKKYFLLLLLLALPCMARAQNSPEDDSLASAPAGSPVTRGPAGSLARVMDSFLRAYAGDNPAWRVTKDVKVGVRENEELGDGWQKARHPKFGWIAFLPKTNDMLSLDERRAVMRDPRFPQFLAIMRAATDGTAPGPSEPMKVAGQVPNVAPTAAPKTIGRAELLARLLAGRKPVPDTLYFKLSAEELLAPGRMVITVQTQLTP